MITTEFRTWGNRSTGEYYYAVNGRPVTEQQYRVALALEQRIQELK